MSKKKLDLDSDEPVVNSSARAEELAEPVSEPVKLENSFPNSALSIVKVGNDYKLIEIGFNLQTGDTSVIKELGSYPSRQEAQERFKISVILKDAF